MKYNIILSEMKMYKKCKTCKSKNRQKEIELHFLNLLKNKHYDDISVSEICAVATIPRKAFYRYYDGKEGILEALILHTLEGYQSFYNSKKKDKRILKNELECYFSFWIKEPQKTFLNAIIKSSLVGHLLKNSVDFPTSNFINSSKFFPEDSPSDQALIFKFAITGLMSLMLDWFQSGCQKSTEEMAVIACRMIEKPLFTNLESLGIFSE